MSTSTHEFNGYLLNACFLPDSVLISAIREVGWLPAIWLSPTVPGVFCGWAHTGKWSPFNTAFRSWRTSFSSQVRPSHPDLLWDLDIQLCPGSALGQISSLLSLRFFKHTWSLCYQLSTWDVTYRNAGREKAGSFYFPAPPYFPTFSPVIEEI